MNKNLEYAALVSALALAAGVVFAQIPNSPNSPNTSMPSASQPASSSPSTAPTNPANPLAPVMPPPAENQSATPVEPASPALANRNLGNATFKDLDLDHDRYLSSSEAASDTALSSDFVKYDTNRDGKLSESEYARYRAQMASRH
jgi:hypothetical protein